MVNIRKQTVYIYQVVGGIHGEYKEADSIYLSSSWRDPW